MDDATLARLLTEAYDAGSAEIETAEETVARLLGGGYTAPMTDTDLRATAASMALRMAELNGDQHLANRDDLLTDARGIYRFLANVEENAEDAPA